jgi:hypothetical protein
MDRLGNLIIHKQVVICGWGHADERLWHEHASSSFIAKP